METLLWWRAALPVSILFSLLPNRILILLRVTDQLKTLFTGLLLVSGTCGEGGGYMIKFSPRCKGL